MEKKNKKPLIFIALLFSVLLVVGGTIAYYTSSDTFENEFDTGTYKIETQEVFQSPDNWTPGTTTPKTVIATNKGTTPAAVRIKFEESWQDKDGNSLPLDYKYRDAAIIKYTQNSKWEHNYDDNYYYYSYFLDPGESTTSPIESVTFSPWVEFPQDKDCETVDGITTCNTSLGGYAGGKYTLNVIIETCQYDKYIEIWNTNQKIRKLVDWLMVPDRYSSSKTFGKSIDKSSFESIITVSNKNVPNDAIDSWDVSDAQNGSIIAWYTDRDNDNLYELYLGQDGGVVANYNSSGVFEYFTNVTTTDFSNFNTQYAERMSDMFYYFGSNVSAVNLDLSSWNTSSLTTTDYIFNKAGYNTADDFIVNITGWDTSNVTKMSDMFLQAGYMASNFRIIGLDNLDVSKVDAMNAMFASAGYHAQTWNIGDLSNWDTSHVRNMDSMFNNAGYETPSWNSIGTLKIYSNMLFGTFTNAGGAKGTFNFYNNPSDYYQIFGSCAINEGSGLVINYTSNVTDIDRIIATKSSNSNITKGSVLD